MRIAMLTAAAACAGLAACLGGGLQQVSRPQVLLDSYLIAHGMATSYAQNPDANLAVVQKLARLDHRAADAVRALAHRGGDVSGTAEAVAALTDYAARQTAAAQ